MERFTNAVIYFSNAYFIYGLICKFLPYSCLHTWGKDLIGLGPNISYSDVLIFNPYGYP